MNMKKKSSKTRIIAALAIALGAASNAFADIPAGLASKAAKGETFFEEDSRIKPLLQRVMGADLEKKYLFANIYSAPPAEITHGTAVRTGCMTNCAYDFVYHLDYDQKYAVIAIKSERASEANWQTKGGVRSIRAGVHYYGGDVVTIYGAKSLETLPPDMQEILSDWKKQNDQPLDDNLKNNLRESIKATSFKLLETKYQFKQ